ncbi:hypothetical protein CCR75_009411 [Bremia lactucae]|uniref:Serine aminopeptidase S33 domain-containing protein n=1 Tax=Bremia lactucae TaxID=4779 RepID=A0A976IGI4_BRELC|nr:hypothetical protein CCR75_009411 [Bremia lactucae]
MGANVSSDMEIFADGEMETELKRLGGAGDASVKEILGKGYHDVVQAVIRPTRVRYDVQQLGPESFPIAELSVAPAYDAATHTKRKDFDVYNDRGLRVCCSHWQLFTASSNTPVVTPCLIYLHSNLGSRLDALRVRDAALQRGFSVLAFDFCGSGISDGVYVTMGWNETLDLYAVLQTLEEDMSVSDICLYAHSMGAFPAITNLAVRAAGAADKKMKAKLQTLPHALRSGHSLKQLKPIRAIVLDSAYASLKEVNTGLLSEIQQEGFVVPKAVIKVALAAINKSIKKRTEVDIDLLCPTDFVELCYAPALFVAANHDRYVSKLQSDELAAKYAGPSNVLCVEGQHFDPRDAITYAQAINFLYRALH